MEKEGFFKCAFKFTLGLYEYKVVDLILSIIPIHLLPLSTRTFPRIKFKVSFIYTRNLIRSLDEAAPVDSICFFPGRTFLSQLSHSVCGLWHLNVTLIISLNISWLMFLFLIISQRRRWTRFVCPNHLHFSSLEMFPLNHLSNYSYRLPC